MSLSAGDDLLRECIWLELWGTQRRIKKAWLMVKNLSPPRRGLERGLRPLARKILKFSLEMEYSGEF